MKVSVSLPEADVETLRRFAATQPGVTGLSGAVQAAVRALRERELLAEYDVATAEWAESGQAEDWATVSADGLAERP
ncbi:antitoxin [Cellulomonas phragmiteti]|uniref:Antitoxin MazE9 n=1 Tax=Cellulomonas phragmiteti TaxID=478780 RepID=A0ABQ4DP36_9CELL|nr:antitoxin [Cellulomonas phragmiteti]GIG41120.1 hypothetical protein Cph01nite_28820 [Cellulomonas phragmiteti]